MQRPFKFLRLRRAEHPGWFPYHRPCVPDETMEENRVDDAAELSSSSSPFPEGIGTDVITHDIDRTICAPTRSQEAGSGGYGVRIALSMRNV